MAIVQNEQEVKWPKCRREWEKWLFAKMLVSLYPQAKKSMLQNVRKQNAKSVNTFCLSIFIHNKMYLVVTNVGGGVEPNIEQNVRNKMI